MKKASRLQITLADIDLFYHIFEYGFLTGEQLSHIVGVSWSSNCALAKRLSKMVDYEYLIRPENAPSKHVYCLGTEGAKSLAHEYTGVMPKKGSWSQKANRLKASAFRPHEMMIRDFLIRLEYLHTQDDIELLRQSDILASVNLGIKKINLTWHTKVTWNSHEHEVAVRPDWMFGIRNKKTGMVQYFFLEVDTGSEPQTRSMYDRNQTILRKVLSYAHSQQQNNVGDFLGINNFHIIFITTGLKRISGMQKIVGEYAR